ncbi:hypothetical protein BKA57DRAFT_448537 [Linnemannia elongata]|nr:hypothetical protein BKA57DRAFT_448537 [Linnemannia elongata]
MEQKERMEKGKERKGKEVKGKEVKVKSRLKITLSYNARGTETIASRRTREWRHHILGWKVLKELMESLENEVDLAELDTDHEQGRKEHQDGAGVLVRDGGSLASDGIKEEDRRNDDRVIFPCVHVLETVVVLDPALIVHLSRAFGMTLFAMGMY